MRRLIYTGIKMSLTKENFEREFHDRTIGDAEYREREANQEPPFAKLPELIKHLNELRGVSLTGRTVSSFRSNATENVLIKGRYSGMIYTEENKTLRTIQSLIESYGFTILKTFWVEEEDEGFTNLSFTIKNQRYGTKKD